MTTEKTIKFNFLGKSGVKVSNLCLGTLTVGSNSEKALGWLFSAPNKTDEVTSHKMFDRFVELGGNFIDTANIYSHGEAESIIGSWMNKRKDRDDMIIATKVFFPLDISHRNAAGLSRRNIMKSCEESLERLQTDYIDLYQAHVWDVGTPIEETLQAFDDLVKSEKIRYYGFCNVYGWQIQKIVDTIKMLNLAPCITLQQEYSLLTRESEHDAFQVCENEGVGVLAYSPLMRGLLTGRYKKGEVPDAKHSRLGHFKAMNEAGISPINFWDLTNNEKYWSLVSKMEQIAKVHEKTVAQIAIRWLLQKKVVTSVVIGCTSLQQLESNMGASTGWEISADEMEEIDDILPPPVTLQQMFNKMVGRIN